MSQHAVGASTTPECTGLLEEGTPFELTFPNLRRGFGRLEVSHLETPAQDFQYFDDIDSALTYPEIEPGIEPNADSFPSRVTTSKDTVPRTVSKAVPSYLVDKPEPLPSVASPSAASFLLNSDSWWPVILLALVSMLAAGLTVWITRNPEANTQAPLENFVPPMSDSQAWTRSDSANSYFGNEGPSYRGNESIAPIEVSPRTAVAEARYPTTSTPDLPAALGHLKPRESTTETPQRENVTFRVEPVASPPVCYPCKPSEGFAAPDSQPQPESTLFPKTSKDEGLNLNGKGTATEKHTSPPEGIIASRELLGSETGVIAEEKQPPVSFDGNIYSPFYRADRSNNESVQR